MKKFLLRLLPVLGIAACAPPQPKAGRPAAPLGAAPDQLPASTVSLAGCYRFVQGGDTAFLHLEPAGGLLEGVLEYRLAEKDRNKGRFSGRLERGSLRGWYRFESEGMTSVREVVFQPDGGGNLREGTGPVTVAGDTARFEPGQALQFGNGILFAPVDCAALPLAAGQ